MTVAPPATAAIAMIYIDPLRFRSAFLVTGTCF